MGLEKMLLGEVFISISQEKKRKPEREKKSRSPKFGLTIFLKRIAGEAERNDVKKRGEKGQIEGKRSGIYGFYR